MDLTAAVSTLMTKKIITVSPNDTLLKAQEILGELNIHHIPVTDKDKLVGIISKTDLLFFVKGYSLEAKDDNDNRLSSFKVKDIMTKGMAKLEETDRINVAVDIFRLNIFHALPVVDAKGKLVGIFTTHDIIKKLASDDDENIKKGLNK